MQTRTCRCPLDDMARWCMFILKSGLVVWMVSARACLRAAYFLCVRARIFVSMKMAFIEGLRHASPNAPSHSAGDLAFIHSIMPTSSGLSTIFAQDSLHVSAQDQVNHCTSPECDTICMCAQATNIVRSFASVGSRAPDKAIPAAILDGAAGFAILSVAKVCARFAPLVAIFQDLTSRMPHRRKCQNGLPIVKYLHMRITVDNVLFVGRLPQAASSLAATLDALLFLDLRMAA